MMDMIDVATKEEWVGRCYNAEKRLAKAQAKIAELENSLAAASGTIAGMREDRFADLPDMIALLVWEYRGNVSCTAHTPFGKYLVETCHEDGYGMWTPRDDTEDDPTFGYHDDIHKGIDAANAHYADAIISEMRKPHGVST
jgi:hypothetical protein